jgi:hypothetical protein
LKNFAPSKASEISDVFANRSSGQNRKIGLCGHKVLWLLYPLRPGLNQLLPLLGYSPLATRTPFDIASVCELFEFPAIFAYTKNFLLAAKDEVRDLHGVVQREDFSRDCLMKNVRVADEFALLVLASDFGFSTGQNQPFECVGLHRLPKCDFTAVYSS